MTAAALPLWGALGLGGLGFLGELLGSKKKETGTATTTSNQTSGVNNQLNELIKNLVQSQTQATSTTAPNMTPGYQSFIDKTLGTFSKNLGATPLTQEQYATPLIQGINRNADVQSQAVNNIMASRGLSTSPVSATSAANIESQRMGDINRTLAGAPLAVNQLNTQAMTPYTNIMSILPSLVGTTTQQTGLGTTSTTGSTQQTGQTRSQTTGGSTTNQTGTVSSGGPGDAFGGLGAILAALYAGGKVRG